MAMPQTGSTAPPSLADPAVAGSATTRSTGTSARASVASAGSALSKSTTTWVLRTSESVQWVAKVNFAWIVLTLMGGVVLGFAPAAFATSALCRERLRSGHDARLAEFVSVWRRDFWRANAVLLPFVAVDALLVTAFSLVLQTGAVLAIVASGAVVLVAALATVLLPSLYSHYEIALGRCIPTATRFVLANPVSMVLLALSCAAIVFVSALVPALIAFLSIGTWMQFSSALCLSFFHTNDQRVAASSPGR